MYVTRLLKVIEVSFGSSWDTESGASSPDLGSTCQWGIIRLSTLLIYIFCVVKFFCVFCFV